MTGAASVLKPEQNFFVGIFPIIFGSILHKITFHLPPTGLAAHRLKLLLSNFETMAPMTMTSGYRPYRHILSIKKAEKYAHNISSSNEAPQ